jgi:hypothetical protein
MVETGILDKARNFKDRLTGGNDFKKEPSATDQELTSGSENMSDISDIPPTKFESTTPDLEDFPPTDLKQSDLKSITSKNLSDVLKDEKPEPVDATLEAFDKGTLSPKKGGEDDYLSYSDETKSDEPKTETKSDEPKTETKSDESKTEPEPTVETKSTDDVLTPEDTTEKGGIKEGVNKVLGIFKKRLPTGAELKDSGKKGILEGESEEKSKEKKTDDGGTTPTINAKERDYAIMGGYKGSSREQLVADNDSLRKENVKLKDDISKIDDDLAVAITLSRQYKSETLKLKDPSYNTTNARATQQRLLDADVDRLEKKKAKLEERINANNRAIRDNNIKISEYDEAVIKGRKIASPRSQIGKKLQKLGEGAEMVSSGVYGGKSFGKGDWFGKQGFLSQPFKQENILKSPLEPVKTSSRSLDNITRSTGGSVARSMIDVTRVRPNKSIAPMGAPGTIYGARQQFDYSIPARKISLLDASGMTRANINRDILPNLYDTPKTPQIPMQQYKEVVQEDGSVIQVPVPAQARKSKIFTVSVNRYTKGVKITGMRVGTESKVNNRIERGVKSVDTGNMLRNIETYKPVSKPVKSSNQISRGVKSVGTVKLTSKLNIDIGGLGQKRTIKPMVIGKRPDIDLGLVNVKNLGIKLNRKNYHEQEPVIEIGHVEDRKAKKDSPLVKMGLTLTGVKLNQNLKKLVSKTKTK